MTQRPNMYTVLYPGMYWLLVVVCYTVRLHLLRVNVHCITLLIPLRARGGWHSAVKLGVGCRVEVVEE